MLMICVFMRYCNKRNMATIELSLLVPTLCFLSVSSQLVFLSIDCGSSSDSYRDENLIVWNGDGNFTSTGESRVVGSRNSVSRVMDSLRVFTNNRKKNCYHIDSVRQGRVLVRASFNYGNYDNRSTPPMFDLQFDGNHWTRVETSSSGSVSYEVIYVMKRDFISVCVAQTREGEFPFVSAIEIRGLESNMYSYYVNETLPLFLVERLGFGLNSAVRYGDDQYDRIWTPGTAGSGMRVISSDTIFSETIATNRPPPAVLQSALTAIRPNSSILLSTGLPPNVYFTWYFTEVTQLGPNDTRSFRISMNNEVFSEPIRPPYQNCSQWYAYDYDVTANYTISLVPTNVSTLPPLINAMEVFEIREELTDGTNRNDVQGLNSLRGAFSELREWTGDPCLPAGSNWDWIECSNNTVPRVTALLLGSFGLSGQLPNFSSMGALQTIDFHNNSLSGRIPDFFGTLPRLTQLNLANNQLVGLIPDSLFRNGLNLVVTGNSGLCTSSNSSCTTSTSTSPQNPGNSSGSNKISNHVLIMINATIAFFIMILFIMY